MTISGTVIELLSLANPRLELGQQPQGSVTRDTAYQRLENEHILPWDDFTYTNISEAYGHLFDLGPVESEAMNIRGTPARIEREDHVDNITASWNWPICRMPIKTGARVIQQDLGLEYKEISMKMKSSSSIDITAKAVKRMPDWSIFETESDSDKRNILVWGDNKCSSKWTSDEIDCSEENWLWPWRQMVTYCANNNVRYGFILTPEELVALRLYRVSNTPLPWRLQYASVPWESSGQEIMTVNMAIWALAMMSLNEGHRPIQSLEWTLPLNVWWEDKDKRETVYVHHLSGREKRKRPQGADVRTRPDTIPSPNGEPKAGPSKRSRTRSESRNRKS